MCSIIQQGYAANFIGDIKSKRDSLAFDLCRVSSPEIAVTVLGYGVFD